MGGVDPTGEYVLELLRRGKHVVTANKQLVARRGAELFAAASAAGVQLRFEASVCAAIPVIKVLRESLVVTNVHRVLGIVNGTTNFMLTEMEAGKTYDEALADAQQTRLRRGRPDRRRLGRATPPRRWRSSPRSRSTRATSSPTSRSSASTAIDALDVAAARELDMVIRLVGAARLVDGHVDVRVGPALVDRHHPLAAVEGAFNAVMLQGDAIREITLEGPGAGGVETASAVIADMASVIGTMGTGFLQNDAVWRSLPRLAARRAPLAVLLPPLGRRRAGRARARDRRAGRARHLDRAHPPAPERRRRRGARRHARGARGLARRRARGDLGAARGAQAGRCRSPSSPTVVSRSSDGRNRPLLRPPAGRPEHAAHHARRGRHAADPLGAARRAARRRALLQVRGHEPDRQLQGPRHVRRGREGGRGRLRGHRLRVDREHRRVGRRVRRARRPDRRRAARRRARSRRRSRRSRARSPRGSLEVHGSFDDALARLPRARRPGRADARQLAQPAPDRGPEDGGVRDRRGARPRARRARAAVRRRREQRRVRQGLLGGGRRDAPRLRAGRRSARRRWRPRSASPSRRTWTRSTTLVANRRVEIVTVDDSEITAAWLEIASNEGLFCEPSSAAGFAGLAHVELEPGSTVVCVLTGHGLKDTAAVDVLAEPTIVVQPNVESILGGGARDER